MSPVLESNGFIKKRPYSNLQCSISCSPEPGTSRSVSSVCCMCFCCCVRATLSFIPIVCRDSLCLLWAVFGPWPESSGERGPLCWDEGKCDWEGQFHWSLGAAGLDVSKVGGECWHCAGSCRWPCAYDEGWGERNGTCQFLCY